MSEFAVGMYLTEDLFKGTVEVQHTLEVYAQAPTRGINTKAREALNAKNEIKFDGINLIVLRGNTIENGNTL